MTVVSLGAMIIGEFFEGILVLVLYTVGEMFGNITGGGTISSKYDYNPTDYVSVVRKNLYKGAIETSNLEFIEVAFIYIDKKALQG